MYSFGELSWKQTQMAFPAETSEPVLEVGLSGQKVVSVAAGGFHSGAVTEDGGVHMWGDNAHGQCGLSGLTAVPNPTPVGVIDHSDPTAPQTVKVLELACGEQHTLALSARHQVWAWGSGPQLGLPVSTLPTWRPQRVEHLAGRHVLQVSCGAFHSLALVRCPAPSQEPRRPPPDKCGQCNQLLYTMTDKEDHVIISDNHHCPLGAQAGELGGSDDRRGSEGSPGKGLSGQQQVKVKSSPSEPLLSTHRYSPPRPLSLSPHTTSRSSPAPATSPTQDPVASSGSDATETAPQEPQQPEATEESRAEPSSAEPNPSSLSQAYGSRPDGGALQGTGAKSSPYPDEQAVKDYLKKLSDHSLSDQASKSPQLAQRSQVGRGKHTHTHTYNNLQAQTFPFLP